MTIIHTKRFVTYDRFGKSRRVIVYRISDSPEFYCHTGLHSWYDEEDSERCCRDGLTQGLIRGVPFLVQSSVVGEKQKKKDEAFMSRLFGQSVQIENPAAPDVL